MTGVTAVWWRAVLVGSMIALWLLVVAASKHPAPAYAQGATPCPVSTAYAPIPEDNAEIIADTLTLRWQIDCARWVLVRHNGTPLATLDATTLNYTISALPGVNQWQITGIDAAENRADGPLWSFIRDTAGWAATPEPIPDLPTLYTPPPPTIQIDLSDMRTVLALLCSSLCAGMGLVVGVAWWLGMRAQRRERQRDQYL
jgi:hypothetical protein